MSHLLAARSAALVNADSNVSVAPAVSRAGTPGGGGFRLDSDAESAGPSSLQNPSADHPGSGNQSVSASAVASPSSASQDAAVGRSSFAFNEDLGHAGFPGTAFIDCSDPLLLAFDLVRAFWQRGISAQIIQLNTSDVLETATTMAAEFTVRVCLGTLPNGLSIIAYKIWKLASATTSVNNADQQGSAFVTFAGEPVRCCRREAVVGHVEHFLRPSTTVSRSGTRKSSLPPIKSSASSTSLGAMGSGGCARDALTATGSSAVANATSVPASSAGDGPTGSSQRSVGRRGHHRRQKH